MCSENTRELRENYRKVNALMRRARMERRGANFPDTQNRVLAVIASHDGISQKELAFILGIRPQSAGELVTKMEANGLVTRVRDENDGRAHCLHLTESGRESYEKNHAVRNSSIFDCLSEDEKSQLNGLLAKIVAANPETDENSCHRHHHHRGMHCHQGPVFPGQGPHRFFR